MERAKVDREVVRGLLRELMNHPDREGLLIFLESPIVQKIQALDTRHRAVLDDLLYCIGHGAPVAIPKRGRPRKASAEPQGDPTS